MSLPSKSVYGAALLAAVLVTACGEKASEAPVEPVVDNAEKQVDTREVTVVEGPVTDTLRIEKSTDESDEAFIYVTETQTLSARVVSVNYETREVVLASEDGTEVEVTAGDETPNLEQVMPGDHVEAEFVEHHTMALVKGADLRAMNTEEHRELISEKGQLPIHAEFHKSINIYTVIAIDLEANTFKLEDVNGEVGLFTARNPANLAKANIGDSLVIATTEAKGLVVTRNTEK